VDRLSNERVRTPHLDIEFVCGSTTGQTCSGAVNILD